MRLEKEIRTMPTSLSANALTELARELESRHRAILILLYGSHARGDANAESDIDILCIAEAAEPTTDARVWKGHPLDAWVYPRSALTTPAEFPHLTGARILLDRDGIGLEFLEAIEREARKPPPPLTDAKRAQLEFWCRKMLQRARRGDAEGNYRRVWLQTDLLPMYFQVRALHFRGPKLALQELRDLDPAAYAICCAALAPTADLVDIEAFVNAVFS